MYLTHWQNNFSAGELSPHLFGRTDLKQYDNACQSIKNFIVRPQGTLVKRPGTTYVCEVKNSAQLVRLVDFEYSTTQAYVLEVGEGYIRFIKDGGQILSTAAITNGTFTTDLTGWTDDDTGTGASTQTAGVMRLAGGAAGVAKRTQAVSAVGTAAYTLTFTVATNTCVYNIGTTSGGTQIATGTGSVGANTVNFTPTTAGTIYIQFTNAANNNSDVDTVALNTPVYQIDNPYVQADLDTLQYTQSFDKLYIAHGSYPLKEITRTAHSNWTITNFTFEDGPYFGLEDQSYGGTGTDITVTLSALTGTITLTAASALFVSTDVGRLFRFRSVSTAAYGWAKITVFTSTTVVSALVERDFDAVTASKLWQLGSFSSALGYPRTVKINESRLVLGGTATEQNKLFFSASGDFNTFAPDNDLHKGTVDDDTAMSYKIGSGSNSTIQWLESQKILFVSTNGGLFGARPTSSGEALTPTNISIPSLVNSSGGAYPSCVVDSTIVYPDRHGRKLTEVRYTFAEDAYEPNDLAILAEARTAGKIKWLARQGAPNALIWGCTEDGKLFSITYIKSQNVLAWAEHVLGGTSVSVKSLVTIPGTNQDEVYFLVSRTINGSTKQYIEYLGITEIEQVVTTSKFLDCNVSYSGSSTTTLTGLTHLEGETVETFSTAGYKVVTTAAVASGSITVDKAVTGAVVGIPYSSVVQFMKPHLDGGFGTTEGKVLRVNKVVVRFYKSYGGSIGTSSSNLDLVTEYSSNTTMDGALVLNTGDREFDFPGGFGRDSSVYFEHTGPVPCNIVAVATKFSSSTK